MKKNKLIINILETKSDFVFKKYINLLHNYGYKYVYYQGKIFIHKEIPSNKMMIIITGKFNENDIKKISKLIKKKKIEGDMQSEEYYNVRKKQIKNHNKINKLIHKIKIEMGIVKSKWT